MTKRDLVMRISEETGLVQRDVLAVLQKTLDHIAAAAKPRDESQGNPEILRYRRTISRKHKAATEIENKRERGASGPKRECEKDRSQGEAAGTSKE